MRDITESLIVFVLSILLHILWCRFKRGQSLRAASFLTIAFAGLFFYILILKFPMKIPDVFGGTDIWSMPLQFTAITMYIALVPLYLLFYYAIIIDSPSRFILNVLQKKEKVLYQEIINSMDGNYFITSRLNALIRHGYVEFNGNVYRLSSRGLRVAKILKLYEKISGRAMGG